MLYTGKGDNGTTSDLRTAKGERKSKSSCETEALGALDELNSFLGLAKLRSAAITWKISGKSFGEIIFWSQQNLFIVQAEVAGADKTIQSDKVVFIENLVNTMEKEMPPIKSFFVSGGTELASLFDISRTLARKAERRVVSAIEDGEVKVGDGTLAFLNRLSTLFYAMARLTNHKSGINEESPTYQ